MRCAVSAAAKEIDGRITVHDFRIVDGPTHTNIIFDAVVPNDLQYEDDEIKAELEKRVHALWDNCHPKINIDRPYL